MNAGIPYVYLLLIVPILVMLIMRHGPRFQDWLVLSRGRRSIRFIRSYRFPESVMRGFAAAQPQLTARQVEQVFQALREYFMVVGVRRGERITMPSRIADEAWHLFLAHDAEYQDFCKRAYGTMLRHHAGASKGTQAAARRHRIPQNDPSILALAIAGCASSSLPLLYRIDESTGVDGGFLYELVEGVYHRPPPMPDSGLGTTAEIGSGSSSSGGPAFIGGGGSDGAGCGDGGGAGTCGGGC